MRRAFFSSTISRRRSVRTFSYSTRLRISDVSSSFIPSLLETVGRRENLDRMLRLASRALRNLQGGQRALGGGDGPAGADGVEQGLRELHRQLVVFLLESPGAVDGRALLDDADRGAGNHPEHVRRFVADVLGAQVAGHVVRHGTDRPRKVRVELAGRVELRQVLEEIAGVGGNELCVV